MVTGVYKSELFGRYFREYIKRKGLSYKNAGPIVSEGLPISEDVSTTILRKFGQGNLLGINPYITDRAVLQVHDHALRLAQILNILGVPKDNDLIYEARKTFLIDFEYPPTSKEFPVGARTTKTRNIGSKL